MMTIDIFQIQLQWSLFLSLALPACAETPPRDPVLAAHSDAFRKPFHTPAAIFPGPRISTAEGGGSEAACLFRLRCWSPGRAGPFLASTAGRVWLAAARCSSRLCFGECENLASLQNLSAAFGRDILRRNMHSCRKRVKTVNKVIYHKKCVRGSLRSSKEAN